MQLLLADNPYTKIWSLVSIQSFVLLVQNKLNSTPLSVVFFLLVFFSLFAYFAFKYCNSVSL